MPKYILFLPILMLFISLSSCNGSSVNTQNSQVDDAQIHVDELGTASSSMDETIHMNNCGGKADSKQTASRSFNTDIEGVASVKIGVAIIEGNVSAKYGQYKNVEKSQELIAPPGTNMEILLRWSEEVHTGVVTVNGTTGTYKTYIPISVEQILSQDLGCNNTPIEPTKISPTSTVQLVSGCSVSENLIAPFTGSYNAASTQYSYSGRVLVTASGTGQSAGIQYTDAFYIFADGNGRALNPEHPTDWILTINGDFAHYLIPNQEIPAYQPNHIYNFEIIAPGGNLSFGIRDGFGSDNTGSYKIILCQS